MPYWSNATALTTLPTIASATPLMHHGNRRKLADVLTAIREGRKVDELGRSALANAEQRLRSEDEMRRLLGPHAGAVDRAAKLAETLTFQLDELRYEYPSEIAEGETAEARLSRLAYEGRTGLVEAPTMAMVWLTSSIWRSVASSVLSGIVLSCFAEKVGHRAFPTG